MAITESVRSDSPGEPATTRPASLELCERLLAEARPRRRRRSSSSARQFDLGLAWVHFPEGHGGLGLSPKLQKTSTRRSAGPGRPGAVGRNPIGYGMGAPTIVTHGSDEQKQRYLRPLFTGEEIWCQLFSEPGAGSDVAGLATRAVRDGDEWVVNGQKVWTTLAHVARWGMLVARTDPDAPKHKGLTYFVVDMQAPGVEVRPLRQITGEAEFNEVYFTDVRIPDAERLGDVGEGWRVSLTTLMNERVVDRRPDPAPGQRASSASCRRPGSSHRARTTPPRRDRADAAVDRGRGAAAHQHPGQPEPRRRARPGPEGSIGKLAMAELNKDISEFAVDLLGRRRACSSRRATRWRRPETTALWSNPPAGVPAVAGQLDRGRHLRDHEEHPRRAGARPARRRPRRQGPALERGAPVVAASPRPAARVAGPQVCLR